MAPKLRIALLLSVALNSLAAEIATLNFENALPLTLTGGAGISVGNHAVPRLIDWNDDGALDLLVAGGDGYLWLFRQPGATDSNGFQPGERITSAGTQIRVGTGYTGACFVDVDHDGLKDLVAAGTDHRLRFYPNVGTTTEPRWEGFTNIRGAAGDFVIPSDVLGRFDLGDWDGDGDLDLITGDFEGYLTWYQNTGSVWAPEFASAGVRLTRGNATIHEPYNTHPRIFDFNQDGILDLAYGINWGYVKILISEAVGATDFRQAFLLRDAAGLELNIRPLINDDTIPDFADLTGDGILDLISGGFNGRLFVLPGISPLTPTLQQIDGIMAAHPDALGAALNQDSVLRQTLFGLHQSLRETALTILPITERERLRDWYCDQIALYPQYLTKRPLDPTTDAFVPYLAGQVWINLFESMPDTFEHRQLTANTAGLTGIHYDLLLDLGILYIENSRSTPASQQVLYDIAASIPTPLQIVEVVTQNDYLKTSSGGSMSLKARAGVNVFAQVGDYSEGFPPEVPQTRIDGFSVVVAHELNHNVELAARRRYPWYDDRKHTLLEQAAPPHLVFKDHRTASFGLDLPATQAVFLAQGFWDGDPASWAAAYNDYWSSGAGTGFERHWLRDNLKLCIEAPQEAFATLANQYFCSSDVMLQLAVTRWNEGITHGIQQFLFFADVYSLGGNDTRFYRVDTAGQVTTSRPSLTRDEKGHIIGLTTPTTQYSFTVDAEGNVLDLSVNPNPGTVAFTVTVNHGTVTITGYTGPGGEVVIPDTIDGLPVTTIGPLAFWQATSLTSVTIPDSVTTIGKDAFYLCTNLTTVRIGTGVTDIGWQAFMGCTSLTSVYFAGDAPDLGPYWDTVFYDTSATIYYRQGTQGWEGYFGDRPTEMLQCEFDYEIADGKVIITGYSGPGGDVVIPETIDGLPVTGVGWHAFAYLTNLTGVVIPDSITSIGNDAFNGCTELTSATIGKGVVTIGEGAFQACWSLTSISLPDSVTSIGDRVFSYCQRLTTITIGNGLTSIGEEAFFLCVNLGAIEVAASNPAYSSVEGVLFNASKTALLKCPQAKSGSYTIPDTVSGINQSAFSSCKALTSVTIPDSVTLLAEDAFGGCRGLTSINIPNSVYEIGRWAFTACTGLTSVAIPDGVVYIGDEAFHSCVGLTNVSIPSSVTSIGYWAFGDCTSLTEISVDPRNPNYTSLDGVLFGYDQTELIQCPGGRTGSYTVPDSVVTIGDHAFARCTGLTSITIPNSVVSVGNHAFAHCAALTSIVVPDSVITLGESSFLGCTGLTSITIPDSVLTIESWAFENCANLASVVIGHGVASIGYGVLWDCLRLTAVYFEGDAPEMPDDSEFDGSQAIIFYLPGTVGWGPTFGGRPTMPWSLTPGDLNGDGEVDRADLDVIVAARNTPAWGPEDPRDLDGDGMITVLDARILVTLFTVPAGFTRIASNPQGVVLEWNENASALTLQSTTNLQSGTWQDVGNLQSETNTVIGTSAERMFFRLVLPE